MAKMRPDALQCRLQILLQPCDLLLTAPKQHSIHLWIIIAAIFHPNAHGIISCVRMSVACLRVLSATAIRIASMAKMNGIVRMTTEKVCNIWLVVYGAHLCSLLLLLFLCFRGVLYRCEAVDCTRRRSVVPIPILFNHANFVSWKRKDWPSFLPIPPRWLARTVQYYFKVCL